MKNTPLVIIDIEGAQTIGDLLPLEAARDRLLLDILRGPEEEQEDSERWDGMGRRKRLPNGNS